MRSRWLPVCACALTMALAPGIVRAGTVTLAWNENPEATVTGYVVLRGTAPGVYSWSADVGATVTWTSADLPAGRYYFAVRAYNAFALSSAASAEVIADIPATIPPPSSPSGLVAAFGFDEGAGSMVSDASGQLAPAGVSGATWAAGRFGTALSFDGVDDWITIADVPALNPTSALTLEAWLKPTLADGWRTALLKERTGGHTYAIYAATPTAGPSAHLQNDADRMATAAARLPVNAWSHLAATFDGVTFTLYVNGIRVAQTAATAPAMASTGPLRIGGNAVWGEYFQGLIDEVRIYARALGASEIAADMNAPIASPAPDTVPPAVSVTAPLSGATLTGVVMLKASATDDIAVAGVKFAVDDVPVGNEDTLAPFELAWDTAAVTDGTHRITAVARDAAGNEATALVTVAVANAPPAPPPPPPPPAPTPSFGPVASFGFDEGSGSTVTDATGRGHIGRIAGASWRSGRFGTALSFDGIDDWVTIADAGDLDPRGGLTIEAWVYPRALDTWRTVMLKESAPGHTYALYAHSGTAGPAGHVQGDSDYIAAQSASLPLNRWTHLAVTFDGAVLRLFVNAREVRTIAAPGGMGESAGPLRLGGNAVWGEFFSGRIDEVRIYDRPLTMVEIAADMNRPVNDGLVAAYAFEEGSGTVAVDAAGGGHHGTIHGAARTTQGRFGSALTFDGLDDSVEIADAPGLDLSGAFTLASWVYPRALATWRTVLLKEASEGHTYALYACSDVAGPGAHAQAGLDYIAAQAAMLPLDVWSHVAAAYDGSTLRLFVNGQQTAAVAAPGPLEVSSGALRIGGNAVWGEFFQGSIDEVRIFNRALGAAEIQGDMQRRVR